MNWIDKALGMHPQALSFRSQRSSVLAANIANADTPGFKAQDYDFKSALTGASGGNVKMMTTQSGHSSGLRDDSFGGLMYRLPTKPISNGNTVEPEVEQAQFSQNAVQYQATVQFLDGAISGLRLAIRGQR